MPEVGSILFISNGYGEDNVAAHIAKEFLNQYSDYRIAGYPTVGQGKFYDQLGVPLAGRGISLPSEGFVRTPKDFFKDVIHGFFRKTLGMGLTLRRASADYGLLVAVGDPYLLLFSTVFTKFRRQQKIFVGIQQSEWYESKKPFKLHYSWLERLWLKWFSALVVVRDTKTRDYLLGKGLNMVFSAGNPMMDCFTIREIPVFTKNKTVIGILPGSKKEAYDNFENIIKILKGLHKLAAKEFDLLYVVAFPPNLDTGVLKEKYKLKKTDLPISIAETTGTLEAYRIENTGIVLLFSKTLFGNILAESRAVIGLSGTANEQAAGLGKPVFTFWGEGPQITEKFLVAQKKLLGEALFLFPPDPHRISREIYGVLKDEGILKKARDDGLRRMAGRGSIKAIVSEIEAHARLLIY